MMQRVNPMNWGIVQMRRGKTKKKEMKGTPDPGNHVRHPVRTFL
jgi:hypothetical protein